MAIVYTKLFCLLEERGISLYRLKKMTGLADGTITSMRNNTSVTTDTLSKICRALCCQPGDITEYIEDSDDLHEIWKRFYHFNRCGIGKGACCKILYFATGPGKTTWGPYNMALILRFKMQNRAFSQLSEAFIFIQYATRSFLNRRTGGGAQIKAACPLPFAVQYSP